MVSPVRKETSARTFGSSSIAGHFLGGPLSLALWHSLGEFVGLNHWASARDRESLGLTVTSVQTLVVYLLAVSYNQRFQPEALPIFRAELLPLTGKGAHLAAIPVLGPQSMDHPNWSPFYHSAWTGKQIFSPTKLLNTAFIPTHSGSLAREPGQFQSPPYSFTQAGSQTISFPNSRALAVITYNH